MPVIPGRFQKLLHPKYSGYESSPPQQGEVDGRPPVVVAKNGIFKSEAIPTRLLFDRHGLLKPYARQSRVKNEKRWGILYKCLKVLSTVLVEVEGILNSKPLGYISSDMADPAIPLM
ncbi:hypothetical protein F2P81_007476 [Scophthalmus maximus]|uniref:Uncharacterized protein n=1 Tax=Scophthalmus maximus TaxID=52904 RepID=A0A6A4T846_SCOMX|nr:hypothetical protein F2P81_007476 [Scophthalmus maximus]